MIASIESLAPNWLESRGKGPAERLKAPCPARRDVNVHNSSINTMRMRAMSTLIAISALRPNSQLRVVCSHLPCSTLATYTQ